ncbi:MAG: transcription repressor NadR [Clostridia bacterium]|nr:transcription repressor NadR [Clostridia bacterium]
MEIKGIGGSFCVKADKRRGEIASILVSAQDAVSGGELAARLGCSRQIIVQDIALLRASGYDIISTHNGYVVKKTPLKERVFKVRHTSADTADELSRIVELGGTVVNVFVWHKVYGKIEGKLNIFSKRGIDQLIDGIKSGKSTELMHITSGYHYHTVRADSEETLDRIGKALDEKGYIVPEI